MPDNITKQGVSERFPLFIPGCVVIGMLLSALLPWPYGYYVLLRFVVAIAAGLAAFMFYSRGIKWPLVLFVPIVIIYNPLIPMHFRDKGVWIVINLCTIPAFLLAVFAYKPESTDA